MSILTFLLIGVILIGFLAMTFGILKQEVAMPLVALFSVCLAGNVDGNIALHEGFSEFSRIAILFTAVAIPAHILQRSKLFDWLGMLIGELVGLIRVKTRIPVYVLISTLCLIMVYLLASLFHNTTSIFVSSIIIYVICKSYNLKSLPVMAGALVASNLGGFSTRWGDTPNIIESAQWGLVHKDFFLEIMPINICALIILIILVSFWLKRSNKKVDEDQKGFKTAHALVRFRDARNDMYLDKRLILVGFIGLILAIIGPLFFLKLELIFSALAIIFSVLGDYPEQRSGALLALGIETYATLASIFVLAQILTHSHIGVGGFLTQILSHSGKNVFAITGISYIGTLLTEAASWASAAAPIVYAHNSSHLGAWALGAGIFSGSSSLVTAASAGIILTQETKNLPKGDQINFGSYVKFGLAFSLLILIFYSIVLSFIWKV